MFTVIVKSEFAAAHYLRNYQGAAEPLHGHNFLVEVKLAGQRTNGGGMLVDFLWVKGRLHDILVRYDHSCLNDLDDFSALEPSAEHIAMRLYQELEPDLPAEVGLVEVTVWETNEFAATYRRPCKSLPGE